MTDKKGVGPLKSFYDDHYYADAVAGSGVSWHLRSLARKVLPNPGRRMLDVACGTGEWLAAASDRNARVSGIDIASRAVFLAKQRLPQGIFAEAVAEALPFSDDCFDLVSCLGALEHFPDKSAALREMCRVLDKDGRALILVPNAVSLPVASDCFAAPSRLRFARMFSRLTPGPLRLRPMVFGLSGVGAICMYCPKAGC